MTKRTVLLGAFILALLLTGSIFSYQTQPQDLPPGVASADWVRLSDNSGVQLTRNKQFLGLPPDDMHGIFYIEVDNAWHRFYSDPAPAPRFRPLGE